MSILVLFGILKVNLNAAKSSIDSWGIYIIAWTWPTKPVPPERHLMQWGGWS
jgi:hypothetical protein